LLCGVAQLPEGQRRERLAGAVETAFARLFRDRVLPRSGRPISGFDAQIAAIARSRNARLATRNVGDFEGCGVALIDPWRAR
jgi:toxin FitB